MDFGQLGFLRVAAIAPPVRPGDPRANGAEIASWIARAAAESAALVVLPELALVGYTAEDLLLGTSLVERAAEALCELAARTASLSCAVVVGLPLQAVDGRRYNTAAVLHAGVVRGAVPKQHLPNSGEFYERRWFTPGRMATEADLPDGSTIAVDPRLLFRLGHARIGIEICEDLWAPEPPSGTLALAGANVIVNPSGSNELVAKADYRRDLVRLQSARLNAAYVYAGSGPTESTKDLVFGGHLLVAENGAMLAEGPRFELAGSMITADIDLDKLNNERARNTTFGNQWPRRRGPGSGPRTEILTTAPPLLADLRRDYGPTPFVPDDPANLDERAREIMAIQSVGLARRLVAARAERAVIGVSGGLDSTLALLVTVEALRRLGRPAGDVLAITMPGLGTTSGTRRAAAELSNCLGVELREIDINTAVLQHFADIGHAPDDFDVVFENSQARERTQILFDVANEVRGIVVGTGDLSELALGWCTYNADHMANYGVNASVPKTLVKHLVGWYARALADDRTRGVLTQILATVISPELLPASSDGTIVQSTEDIIGPYELHDFFLFHHVRNGFSPRKVRALATRTFAERHEPVAVEKWLRVFLDRFYRQQFKRTTLPPGPKVGSVSLSPRGDLRLPDEIDPAAMLAELDQPD